jgi:hypothetical protein
MNNKSVYIVTKPIQYINACNIRDENDKDLLLVPWFDNSAWFVENIALSSSIWKNVSVYNSRNKAVFEVLKHKSKYCKIFIDTDYGVLLNLLFLLLKPFKINIYEEGWGTYQPISYKASHLKIYKFLMARIFFHWNNYIGGSVFANQIIVYHPTIIKKYIPQLRLSKISTFKLDFITHLNSLPDLLPYWNRINIDIYYEKKILLFVTSWPNVSYDCFENIKSKYTDYTSVLKLHPHFLNNSIDIESDFDIVIDRDIPIEIFLSKIASISSEIVVVHENSSAIMYFQHEKMKCYNISQYPIEYLI